MTKYAITPSTGQLRTTAQAEYTSPGPLSDDLFHSAIFKLLKGFKLQQYAGKISDMGY